MHCPARAAAILPAYRDRVRVSLAKRVEPDDLASEFGCGGKDLAICRERNPKARLHEIGLEAGCERRVCRNCGDVGHHILCADRLLVSLA